ncbi:hypothetical protein BU17DRAFT_57641, partial [Hysterangium stoloniferum]
PLATFHRDPGDRCECLVVATTLVLTHRIAVIFHDPVESSGHSTHLPERKGDGAFWTEELFCDELNSLVQHLGIQDDFYILGHPW